MDKSVIKVSVYKAIVVTTALMCLLSFANAEQFVQSTIKEVTHYSGSGDFICSRSVSDDRTDIPQNQVTIDAVRSTYIVIPVATLPAIQQCYTLINIRGPPAASASL